MRAEYLLDIGTEVVMMDGAKFEVGKVYIGSRHHHLLATRHFLCTAIYTRGEYPTRYVFLRRVYPYPNGLKVRAKVYRPEYGKHSEIVHIPHDCDIYAEKVYEGEWYEGNMDW